MRYFVSFTLAAIVGLTSLPGMATVNRGTPVGGNYKHCHGYIRHVSAINVRVHCIDGIPADMSFVSFPKIISARDGRSYQSKDLKPNTPVHVIFTQSLGVRHAYKVFVADPRGRGLYGFKT
ncbi:MAG: hypothetical protein GIW98_04870 [Candidatus Eremiobacteraeota bacterium]|nr:hypothetical protein [Candidatus Eremiobacteraeota bacterium]